MRCSLELCRISNVQIIYQILYVWLRRMLILISGIQLSKINTSIFAKLEDMAVPVMLFIKY